MAIKTTPAASRCLGLPSSIDSPSRLVHPRARELYEHLRTFPWDVSCLTYLRCRHEIFPEVFAGKSTTTQLVEYLVELRFLATALNGWSEVALGRSPHHLAPLDKRFIIFSIANAYHELPDVLKELMTIKDRSYSSSVKKYCDEVHLGLTEIYRHPDIKALHLALAIAGTTPPPRCQHPTLNIHTFPPSSRRELLFNCQYASTQQYATTDGTLLSIHRRLRSDKNQSSSSSPSSFDFSSTFFILFFILGASYFSSSSWSPLFNLWVGFEKIATSLLPGCARAKKLSHFFFPASNPYFIGENGVNDMIFRSGIFYFLSIMHENIRCYESFFSSFFLSLPFHLRGCLSHIIFFFVHGAMFGVCLDFPFYSLFGLFFPASKRGVVCMLVY